MPDLTHGPLVGATTADGVAIWLRADGPAEAEVRVAAAADLSGANPGTATTVRLEAERDFTAVLFCTGLTPDTAYVYRVLLDGQAALFPNFDRQASFRTFPAPDEEAPSFSFAFGSCFNAEYHEDVIFNNLIRQEGAGDPRFFLMIGDNTYVDYFAESRNERDSPPVGGLLALYRASYRASWRHPIFRRALMSTPTFMIFDDHEIWNNWNNSLDFQHDQEALAAGARAYWEYQDSHNPATAARHAAAEPTYHYSFSYGKDIGFFVLDCRMRRNPKAVPFPTILGEEQRVALFQWLRDHKTDYRAKFIVSSVPISFVALPHTIIRLLHSELGDQWIGYPEERLELFKFIQQEQIEGVHFLSGDIHLGQGLAIKAAAEQPGPTVYGYTSSPLANAFYLLPEKMPSWFSTVFGIVVGLLLGYVAARFLLGIASGWGVAAGLLVGAIAGRQWRRWRTAGDPQFAKEPGIVEAFLYRLLRTFAHQAYFRRLVDVANDEIKGGGVHYTPENLFAAVNAYNLGIVTVDRGPGDRLTVHFKLVDPEGKSLGSEGAPHEV